MANRVLVCGGRHFGLLDDGKGNWYSDYPVINSAIDTIKEYKPTHIISGGATGADQIGVFAAQCIPVEYSVYKADWHTHGKAAGMIRNRRMLIEGKPDLVLAFPGGKGTANMVEISRKAGVKVVEIS
jgi:hypothetical protein